LLERHDLDILENYIQRRLALIRRTISLTKRLSKLKKTSGEIIQILDTSWLRPHHVDDESLEDEKSK
jgi:hypothetical protein